MKPFIPEKPLQRALLYNVQNMYDRIESYVELLKVADVGKDTGRILLLLDDIREEVEFAESLLWKTVSIHRVDYERRKAILNKKTDDTLFVIYDDEDLPIFSGTTDELKEYLNNNYTREEQAQLTIVRVEDE